MLQLARKLLLLAVLFLLGTPESFALPLCSPGTVTESRQWSA
jgi:hypothetical protein